MINKNKPKILVIVGTVRQERKGRKIAEWYLRNAKKATSEMEFELFDVGEQNLPLFNEPFPPSMHKYGSLQKELAKKIAAADGFVIVTGEYNHSVPGSLKNFLDYIKAEWNRKAVAYVGYGSVGGARAIEHLIPIMTELQVVSVANSMINIMITNITKALDEKGTPKPEFTHGDIAKQLQELQWYVTSLKKAREETR